MPSLNLASSALRTSLRTPACHQLPALRRSLTTTPPRLVGANALPDEAKSSNKAAKSKGSKGGSTAKPPSPEEAGEKLDAMSRWKKEEQKISKEEAEGKAKTER
ncbi:hypothetical protein MBLNU230_g1275t1 [Neophaeotheca triangularis]